MKTNKTYIEGAVEYHFSGKWRFKIPSYKFQRILRLRGGHSVAQKVAKAIDSSVKRCNKRKNKPDSPIDGLCKNAIRKHTDDI